MTILYQSKFYVLDQTTQTADNQNALINWCKSAGDTEVEMFYVDVSDFASTLASRGNITEFPVLVKVDDDKTLDKVRGQYLPKVTIEAQGLGTILTKTASEYINTYD